MAHVALLILEFFHHSTTQESGVVEARNLVVRMRMGISSLMVVFLMVQKSGEKTHLGCIKL